MISCKIEYSELSCMTLSNTMRKANEDSSS
jgi:hypothetical protein